MLSFAPHLQAATEVTAGGGAEDDDYNILYRPGRARSRAVQLDF